MARGWIGERRRLLGHPAPPPGRDAPGGASVRRGRRVGRGTPGGGSSFDIGRLTEAEKASVPWNTVRPLFQRSSFQDRDEGADVLDLGLAVDAALGNETAGGRNAALVFVDVPRFPGAFRIAGAYTTQGVMPRVRFRLRRGKQAVTDWITVSGRDDEVAAKILAATRRSLPVRGR